ncbi:glutamate receptor ionotropic, delta-1-like [Palaemon carinicauda]|uniref:glutamate receptor ionotropic, delta-1-like n=1 Tax=Palaemon carinicauda TaxID=392227 RepID=UPI0035B5C721
MAADVSAYRSVDSPKYHIHTSQGRRGYRHKKLSSWPLEAAVNMTLASSHLENLATLLLTTNLLASSPSIRLAGTVGLSGLLMIADGMRSTKLQMYQLRSNRPEVLDARARLVWMWYYGASAHEIASRNGVSTSTVYKWIRRWTIQSMMQLGTKSLACLMVTSIVNLLSLTLITGELPKPRHEEALLRSSEALNDLLKLTTREWCSLVLIMDGTFSSDFISNVIKVLNPKHGLRLYEVSLQTTNQNRSQQYISDIVNTVTKFRISYECVSTAAFSDDVGFLDQFANAYKYDLLLIWKNRPFIVTRLPLQELNALLQRHWVLFAGNAKVLQIPINEDSKSLLKLYTHLPYGPENGGHAVQIAAWSEYKGMTDVPYNDTFSAEYRESCCKGMISVKDALNNPLALSRLLHDPESFRFKVPVQATVAVAEWSAHITVNKDELSNTILISGPTANVVFLLAKTMNFTMKLVEPEDGQWGSINPDASWTGLIGKVHRHEADFTTGPHDITEIRSKYIDFTIPLIFDARKFVVAQKQAEVDPWGFLYPLSALVWVLTLVSLCIVAVLTSVVGRNYSKDPFLLYLYAVVFHTYRLLLQQGITMKLRKTPERVLVAGWLVASMIIYWSYGTSLISLLAVRYAPRPIETIRDLLNNDKMIVIFPFRTAVTDYLFSVESGQLKELADLSKVGRYTDVPWWEFDQALENQVSHGTHVLATDTIDSGSLIAGYFSKTGVCQFYIAREPFIPYTMGLVFQKGSPLIPAVNHRLHAIFEAGLYYYWQRKNVANSTACNHMPSKFTVREPLSLPNIWGLFATLMCCLSIAGMAFCVEIVITKIP